MLRERLLTTLFAYGAADHPDLHSFPTRRSSDLRARAAGGRRDRAPDDRAGWPLVRGHARRRRLSFGRSRVLAPVRAADRKSTRLNSSHTVISYAVFCLKKKTTSTASTCTDTPCK